MQPIIGHGSSETCPFQQSKEADLYFVEDADVNLASLASSKIVPTHLGCTTVKGKWVWVGDWGSGAVDSVRHQRKMCSTKHFSF